MYGRKKFLFYGNIVSLTAFTALLLSDSFEVLIGCMVTMGAMSTIRVQISSIYFYEMVARKHFKCSIALLGVGAHMCGISVALYFRFFSKDAMQLI